MYQLYFYVPIDYLEQVKRAVFGAGAGGIGHYEECCFETTGQGQYRPAKGSQAFSGEIGKLSKVSEVKVEMVCNEACKNKVQQALLNAHPYEQVAYGFISLSN